MQKVRILKGAMDACQLIRFCGSLVDAEFISGVIYPI